MKRVASSFVVLAAWSVLSARVEPGSGRPGSAAGSAVRSADQERARDRSGERHRLRHGRRGDRREDRAGRRQHRSGIGPPRGRRHGSSCGARPHRHPRTHLLRDREGRVPEQRRHGRPAGQPLVPQRTDDARRRGWGRMAELRAVQGAGDRPRPNARAVVHQHRGLGDEGRTRRAEPGRHGREAHRDADQAARRSDRRHQGGPLRRHRMGSGDARRGGRAGDERSRDGGLRRAHAAAVARGPAAEAPQARRHPDPHLRARGRQDSHRGRGREGPALRLWRRARGASSSTPATAAAAFSSVRRFPR